MLQKSNKQATIVMFWKTNCSGSKMQLSEVNKLYKKYGDQGLEVIYLSPDTKMRIQNFRKTHNVSGLIGQVNKATLVKPYQLLATPSVYLIDKKGIVQDVWLVPKKLEALEEKVKPYL